MTVTFEQFEAELEAGPYAWPGGYPRYFIMSDGDSLSFNAAKDNKDLIADAIREYDNSGWRVVACEVNWEDTDLYCAHTNKRIPSAYGEDE
jgi:hypothetical protein